MVNKEEFDRACIGWWFDFVFLVFLVSGSDRDLGIDRCSELGLALDIYSSEDTRRTPPRPIPTGIVRTDYSMIA